KTSAGFNDQIVGWDAFARFAATVCQLARQIPNLIVDRQLRNALLHFSQHLPLVVLADASPKLNANYRAPHCLPRSHQETRTLSDCCFTPTTQSLNPGRGIDQVHFFLTQPGLTGGVQLFQSSSSSASISSFVRRESNFPKYFTNSAWL